MILVIDTIQKECLVQIIDDELSDQVKWLYKEDTGSEILKKIKNLLNKHQKKITDLRAILVNVAPGSYTGVRIGVTVANTLAWSLNIPVFGYTSGNYSEIIKRAQKTSSSFSELALPTYSDI